MLLVVCAGAWAGGARAHSSDGVHHSTTVEIQPRSMAVKFAIFAGITIQDEVVGQIDVDGDGLLAESELHAWIDTTWAPAMSLSLDAQTNIPISSENARATVDGDPSLVFLSQPLLIEVDVPIPTDGLPHQLLIRNNYEWERSDYDLQVLTAEGAEGAQLSNNGRAMVVEFETDPDAAGGELTQASYSTVINSAGTSFGDKVMDNALWIGLGVLALAVIGYLGYLRYAERKTAREEEARKQARKTKTPPAKTAKADQARSTQKVRQSQAKTKKPVAVKTIDAPDE